MNYFKHKTNASEREFMRELEDQFGLEGYARWFKLLEKIGAIMGGESGCAASFPWSDWQRFLKGKRNKLETFLKHLENKQRISLKQTGNILEIECPKLLEIRDEYSRKSGQTPKKIRPRIKSIELRVKNKEKPIAHPADGAVCRFEQIWADYPERKGKKRALASFTAQVKTDQDWADIQTALENYKADMVRIRNNGHPDRAWQHGSTWFNGSWRDFVDYQPPEIGDGGTNWDEVPRETPSGGLSGSKLAKATHNPAPTMAEERNAKTEAVRAAEGARGRWGMGGL